MPGDPVAARRKPISSPLSTTSIPSMKRRLLDTGLSIFGGLLLCASFPPVGLWPAAIVGIAVFGWTLSDPAVTRRAGAGYGMLFGLSFYVPLLPWTGVFVGAGPWLALSLLCALFPSLFAVAAASTRALPGWPIWWAALWIGSEWLKSVVPFGGFPWGVVGFGQAGGHFGSYARIGGVCLASFAAVFVGFSVTAVARAVARSGARAVCCRRTAAVLAAASLVWIVAVGLWAGMRASDGPFPSSLTVAAVQGNVPRLGLDFNAQRRAVLSNHVNQTFALAQDVVDGSVVRPQLVVWPENSSDIDPLEDPLAADLIDSAARAVDAPLLVGAVVGVADSQRPANATKNSVIVWSPDTGPGQHHDKKILQPFGEYMPWRTFFRMFSDDVDRAGNFVPGDGSGVVDAAGTRVGIATCWEVVFDRAPREAVRNGAEILIVPSNNATFTAAMSRQQLAFARIRAIEHGRTVVVAATTGISAVIRPDGTVAAQTDFFEPAYLVAETGLSSDLTIATRWAPTIQVALIGVGVGALLTPAAQRLTRRRDEGTNVGTT